jgi:predicted amino acid dehydrogenase
VQHGTPLHVVQEMAAWKSAEMVRRYAHLAPAHLAKHAEVVAGLLNDTSAAQDQKDKGPAEPTPL